jgi:hypothetical protein
MVALQPKEARAMWLLQLKNTGSLYYGDLQHPFQLFVKKDEAENYIHNHELDNILDAVQADEKILNKYFCCTF